MNNTENDFYFQRQEENIEVRHPCNNILLVQVGNEYETYEEMEKDQKLDNAGTPNSVFKSEKKYYPGTAPDVRDDSLGKFRDLGKPEDKEKYFSSVQLPHRFGGGRDFVTDIMQSDLVGFICFCMLILFIYSSSKKIYGKESDKS